MRHIDKVSAVVRRQPERIVLIGAQADRAETEYGWIQPGEPVDQAAAAPILSVTRFREKPSQVQANAWFETRCFWNTFRAGRETVDSARFRKQNPSGLDTVGWRRSLRIAARRAAQACGVKSRSAPAKLAGAHCLQTEQHMGRLSVWLNACPLLFGGLLRFAGGINRFASMHASGELVLYDCAYFRN